MPAAFLLQCLCWLRHLAWLLPVLMQAQSALAEECAPRIVSVMAAKEISPGVRPVDAWQTVALPDNWSQRWPGYDGAAWYRIDWMQACSGLAQAPAVALAIDAVSMAGEVFINDDLLWRDRHLVEPLSRSWHVPRHWLLPASALHAPGSLETLWVRAVGVAAHAPGLGVVELGTPQAIQSLHEADYWRSREVLQVNIAISATLGGLAFLTWLANRRHSIFGWYALASLCWVAFVAQSCATETWPYPDTQALVRVIALAQAGFAISFCIFTWLLAGLSIRPWQKKTAGVLVAVLAALALLPGWQGIWLAGSICSLLLLGNGLYTAWHSLRQGLRIRSLELLCIGGCLLLMAVVSIRDALVLKQILLSRSFYSPYLSLLFMLMAAALMYLRMLRDSRRMERFNQELSEAVGRARADLGTTMAHEHALSLSNARLQERLQLAHDLHDGLGGQVVRSILQVEQGAGMLEKQRVLSMLKLLRDDLRQVVDSGASVGATVPAKPQEWMAPLRHRFVSLFDELDIASQWLCPPTWLPPSAMQCLLLARVTEEALTNIVKHSQARSVSVMLEADAVEGTQRLVLRIQDDGVGFDVHAVQLAGMGIGMSSMRARMERLGGSLYVESRPGATIIEAILPLQGNPG